MFDQSFSEKLDIYRLLRSEQLNIEMTEPHLMLGWGEIVLIVVLAIILLGPDKLAEVARTLGRIYGEYKMAKRRLELELLYGYEIPTKEKLEEIARKKLEAITADVNKIKQVLNSSNLIKKG